jgi:glycosyltransferase involved in cell wall biosynthesis
MTKITNKKIIIFMPSMDGGGVEKNIILIANYLVGKFTRLTLITYNRKFNENFNKKIIIRNFTNNKVSKVSKYFKYFGCLLILLKELILNKNCLVLSFQANIYALILCKILKKKIIIRSNSSPSGWTKNSFKNLIFKYFFKYAKSIIVNSNDFKREIDLKFNITSLLIYNPLNKKDIIKKSKTKIKNLFFSKNNKILKIINIGRFTDQKDQITIIKAANILKDKIKFKIIIMGYGTNQKKLEFYIKKYNLKKNIRIVKYNINPYPFLKQSDLFVLSSKYEGLPNVLLEAITLKKYIISTNCPTGPREILNNGKFGDLFKIGDYKKLSELIVNYYFNKEDIFFKKKTILAFKSLHKYDFEKNMKKYYLILKKN